MLSAAFLTLLCLSLCKLCCTQPNIVFILADDYGYNDIGYHAVNHHSGMKTPFLDSLAASGVKLENYYVQPICTPSRSQLLSGRYQIHTGLQHGIIKPAQPNALPLDNILLPEQLRKCGYDTHMVGKWHLGFYKKEYLPWNRGFNTYFGYLTGSEDYYTHRHCIRYDEVDTDCTATNCINDRFCGYDMDSKLGPTNKTFGEYSAHLFARKAVEAINLTKKNKPMFLYLALQSVHSPLEVPESYMKPFAYIKDKSRQTYAGMVAAMDEVVKNVTDHLKAVKRWNNTILIFSTDNGGQVFSGGNNWPLRGNKGTLWEGGVRGVGFVHYPSYKFANFSVKPNTQLVHISDWYPTMMGISQCPYIKGTQPLDGFDQWDVIAKQAQSQRTEILHNIDPLYHKPPSSGSSFRMGFDTLTHAAIRVGKWKLLTGLPGFDKWVRPPEWQNDTKADIWKNFHSRAETSNNSLIQLYHIEKDPYERHDLSAFYPEIVDLLLKKLAAYNATAVPVRYPALDPEANPQLRDGFWGPWM